MGTLKKLYNFREFTPPEALFALTWNPEVVEQEVLSLRTRFLTIEEVRGSVQRGDFVLILLPEANGQKEKSVQINVGKHFYDQAFEEELMGVSLGTTVTMPARDKGRTGIIVGIKRRVLPELSDTLAERMGIPGISTVDEYREMKKQESIQADGEKKRHALVGLVTKDTVKHSVFGDLSELVAQKYAAYEADFHRVAQMSGVSYEEIRSMYTPEQYDTPEKQDAYWMEKCESDIRLKLVAEAFVSQQGKTFTKEEYQDKCQELLAVGATQEQLNAQYPFEVFLESAPVEYFQKSISEYFEDRFHTVEPA